MNRSTKKPSSQTKKNQWIWFISLWLGGLAGMFLLAGIVKAIMAIAVI